MTPERMTPERHDRLRIFFEGQDHTKPPKLEAELWRELERLRADNAQLMAFVRSVANGNGIGIHSTAGLLMDEMEK